MSASASDRPAHFLSRLARRLRPLGPPALLLVMLGCAAAALGAMERAGLFDLAFIDRNVTGQGLSGEALVLALGALATALGLPRQVLAFLAGYAFGLSEGLLIALAATLLGATLAFGAARAVGRSWVSRRIPRRLARFDRFLATHPFNAALIARLMPFGNNLAVNLVAGLSAARLGPFLAGSALGYLPQTAIFALLGSGARVDPVLRTALAVVLFAASVGLGWWLLRRDGTARAMAQAASEDGTDPPPGPGSRPASAR